MSQAPESSLFYSQMKSDSDSSYMNPSFLRQYGSSQSDKSNVTGTFPISYNSVGGTAGANHFYKKL